jgi:site-specific DNA-methyltransferase (adenine-specific)
LANPVLGDNLNVLAHISDEPVDLIYLDPPLNSNRSYNVLFRGHAAVPFWFGSAQG